MNHQIDAAKAAGVSAPQKENAPTENSKGASKKRRHFILQFLCNESTIACIAMIAAPIAYWLHKGGAV